MDALRIPKNQDQVRRENQFQTIDRLLVEDWIEEDLDFYRGDLTSAKKLDTPNPNQRPLYEMPLVRSYK